MTGLYDNIGESAAAPGTGSVTLAGALSGHKAFDDSYSNILHPATNVPVKYKIVDSSDASIYERGRGLYTKSGSKTLARTTVYESSSANGTVNFTGAVKVYIALDSRVFGPELGTRISKTTGGSSTAYTLTNAPVIPELIDGQMHIVEFHTACGTSPTLNVDGRGAKNLVDLAGNNYASGGLLAGPARYLVSYRSASDKYIVLGAFQFATSAEVSTGTEAGKPVAPDTLAANYAGQGKQTIWIPASAMVARSTNGAALTISERTTNKNMVRTLDFDTATQEFAQFVVAMPKEWDEGTITFEPVWTFASSSGGVVWALQAVAVSNDDATDVAFGTEQTSTDTALTAGDAHLGPESSGITVGGTPAEKDSVMFQIKRNVSDGSDTLGADAQLIGVRLYFSTNARNSA